MNIIFTDSFIRLWFTSVLHPGHVDVLEPEIMQQAIQNSTEKGDESHVTEGFSCAQTCDEKTTTEAAAASTWGNGIERKIHEEIDRIVLVELTL